MTLPDASNPGVPDAGVSDPGVPDPGASDGGSPQSGTEPLRPVGARVSACDRP